MEQRPSWEANWFSANQEFPISWNPKVLYRFKTAHHLYLSSARSIQSMPPPSHFLKIHLNIILPSMPGSTKWSLSLKCPHQSPVHTSTLLHKRYMPHPSQSYQIDHPNSSGWVQIIKLLIIQFPPLLYHLVPLGPKYSQNSFLKHLQPTLLHQCERPSFTPIKNRLNYSSVHLLL